MKRQENDSGKMEKLYTLYEQKMYLVAFSILKNSWQAEDAVQNAFLKLMRHRNKIDDVECDETKRLMIRTVQRTAIDIYRKNRREAAHLTVVPDRERDDTISGGNPVEEMLKEMGSVEEVNEILSLLPAGYREVVRCRCIDELSVRETAERLDLSEAAVRKRYERAKSILTRAIGDEKYVCKVI